MSLIQVNEVGTYVLSVNLCVARNLLVARFNSLPYHCIETNKTVMKFVRSIPAFIAIVCLTIMLLAIFLGNVPTKEHKRSNINSDFCVVPSNIENYQSDLEKQRRLAWG